MLTRRTFAAGSSGFSLIELMIVVVIVAVLMTVALPVYQHQMMRSNRAAAQAEMLEIAGLQQQHLLATRRYMDASALAAAGHTLDSAVSKHYRSSLVLGTGAAPGYQLRFTPTGSQQADGWLQLDGDGNYSSQYEGKWWRR